MQIPKEGLPPERVLELLQSQRAQDADWRNGRTFSLVYHAGEEHARLLERAYTLSFAENGLSPVAFPSLRRCENEVIAMAAHLLGGRPESCGSLTSGGTESILLALKTARDWARRERGIERPQALLPVTVHPAFEKAVHYLGIEAVHFPLDVDLRADVQAARGMIGPRTALLVGSAPCYPYGVVDPIEEIAALALESGILCHVDACLGGFMLPWLARLGRPVPPFDFSVPGVTSISADLHKYGFAAKGASCILYRDRELRRHQYFAYPDWPGGVYVSPGMTGTRPGGAIAAAWAALHHLGEQGYLEMARGIMDTSDRLLDGIRRTPGLRVLGQPVMSVFAFTLDGGNVYALGEEMRRRGWHLDQLQNPGALHLMITPPHARVVEPFLEELAEATRLVLSRGEEGVSGMAAVYGMLSALDDRSQAAHLAVDFLDQLMTPENS